MTISKRAGSLLLLALLCLSSRQLHAAPAPFAIDVKELDQLERQKPAASPKPASPKPAASPAPKAPGAFELDVKELDRPKPAAAPKPTAAPKPEMKKAKKAKKKPSAVAVSDKARESAADGAEYVRYTVRPGDHIFKILMGPFGMSNDAAECLIPEVIRINKIENIKKLRVGQTLLVPAKGRAERGEAPAEKEKAAAEPAPAAVTAAPAPVAPARQAAPTASGPGAPAPAPKAAPDAPTRKSPPAPAPAAAPKAAATAPAPAATAPAPAAPRAPESAPVAAAPRQVPAPLAAPAAAAGVTWVCSVTDRDQAKIVDAVLNALSVSPSTNKIVQSSDGAATAFSIRVDRYFEYKGTRYIVSLGDKDPYSYTLLRILESAGYRVLRVGAGEDFKTVGEKLLTLMGVAPEFGTHPLQDGKESTGFLVQPDDAGGRRVVLTGAPVDPRQKWLMKQGCAAR